MKLRLLLPLFALLLLPAVSGAQVRFVFGPKSFIQTFSTMSDSVLPDTHKAAADRASPPPSYDELARLGDDQLIVHGFQLVHPPRSAMVAWSAAPPFRRSRHQLIQYPEY